MKILWGRGSQNMEAPVLLIKIIFLSLMISYNNQRDVYKLTFRDFRETKISTKSVDSVYVLWRPRGYLPGRSHLNHALFPFHQHNYSMIAFADKLAVKLH
jgi:hypothetical protein